MKIEHIAIWVNDLEAIRLFYIKYFGATSNTKYINPVKKFQSYFLSFNDGGPRIEIMQKEGIGNKNSILPVVTGLAHFAVCVGSKEKVDALTEWLRADGYTITGEPRTTGDGYYESVVLDPEENCIEITV